MDESRDFEQEILLPSALEALQRAEIDVQIATAKRYPRDIARVRREIVRLATLDQETAEQCFYTLMRHDPETGKKKPIQGPSIRLAEIAISCYGNIRAGARPVSNDGKTITCQGVCHDLETNVAVSVEVKRSITKSNGKSYSQDMQTVVTNAANAIALRNAAFKVIPGVFVRQAFDAAKKVAVGEAKSFSINRDKVIKRLADMGVSVERVLAVIERNNVEEIDQEDLTKLIGLGTAIRDGEVTIEDAFPEIVTAPNGPRRKSDSAKKTSDGEKPQAPTNLDEAAEFELGRDTYPD